MKALLYLLPLDCHAKCTIACNVVQLWKSRSWTLNKNISGGIASKSGSESRRRASQRVFQKCPHYVFCEMPCGKLYRSWQSSPSGNRSADLYYWSKITWRLRYFNRDHPPLRYRTNHQEMIQHQFTSNILKQLTGWVQSHLPELTQPSVWRLYSHCWSVANFNRQNTTADNFCLRIEEYKTLSRLRSS